MEKFIAYIDYKAGYKADCGKDFEYVPLNAKSLIEAIAEVDTMWNDKIYLIRIMQKDGKIEKVEDYKTERYKAILCRRSYGWHQNTEEYSESEHVVKKCYTEDWENYEIIE